ncbi:MAG: YihY/virulence factor BrkB family protein [Actinobacteria bacterium]|nr:YihY/virulence factor BrkB family protein [Actinomycetota bacterium]MBW3649851.1 YihY/virulence factor BrkB family protein [Actinomycetota bacterium]
MRYLEDLIGRLCSGGGRLRPLATAAGTLRREARDDRLTGLAAEVAFFAVLGIFPGLLALAAGLGFVEALLGGEVAERAQQVVMGFLTTFLTDRASETVAAIESLFDEGDAAVLSSAMAGAIWAVWRAIRAAMRALAVVYDVEEARSPVKVAALTLVLALSTLLVAVTILVMFVVGPLFGGGQAVAGAVGLGEVFSTLWRWGRIPFGFVVLVLWAATMFHLAPHRRSSFRSDLPGALVTGVLCLLFSAGLRLYAQFAGGVNQVLGVIGGVLTVLLWMYLLSLALLIGGELNGVLAGGGFETRRSPPHSAGKGHPAGSFR